MSTDSATAPPSDKTHYASPLDSLLAAALSGGRIVQELFTSRRFDTLTKSSESDLVTSADQIVEHHITTLLSRLLPEAVIVGEESVENSEKSVTSDDRDTILIDPLDGTTNFVHGYSEVAVSIALWRGGAPVAGVVYNPLRDDVFTAVRNRGANHNGIPLKTSTTSRISTSLVGSGWPYNRSALSKTMSSIELLAAEAREIRTIGSAALGLCYTAAGVFDAFLEFRLAPWDIAAGILIAAEAGAIVSSPDGSAQNLYTGDILAANPFIHQLLSARLATA